MSIAFDKLWKKGVASSDGGVQGTVSREILFQILFGLYVGNAEYGLVPSQKINYIEKKTDSDTDYIFAIKTLSPKNTYDVFKIKTKTKITLYYFGSDLVGSLHDTLKQLLKKDIITSKEWKDVFKTQLAEQDMKFGATPYGVNSALFHPYFDGFYMGEQTRPSSGDAIVYEGGHRPDYSLMKPSMKEGLPKLSGYFENEDFADAVKRILDFYDNPEKVSKLDVSIAFENNSDSTVRTNVTQELKMIATLISSIVPNAETLVPEFSNNAYDIYYKGGAFGTIYYARGYILRMYLIIFMKTIAVLCGLKITDAIFDTNEVRNNLDNTTMNNFKDKSIPDKWSSFVKKFRNIFTPILEKPSAQKVIEYAKNASNIFQKILDELTIDKLNGFTDYNIAANMKDDIKKKLDDGDIKFNNANQKNKDLTADEQSNTKTFIDKAKSFQSIAKDAFENLKNTVTILEAWDVISPKIEDIKDISTITNIQDISEKFSKLNILNESIEVKNYTNALNNFTLYTQKERWENIFTNLKNILNEKKRQIEQENKPASNNENVFNTSVDNVSTLSTKITKYAEDVDKKNVSTDIEYNQYKKTLTDIEDSVKKARYSFYKIDNNQKNLTRLSNAEKDLQNAKNAFQKIEEKYELLVKKENETKSNARNKLKEHIQNQTEYISIDVLKKQTSSFTIDQSTHLKALTLIRDDKDNEEYTDLINEVKKTIDFTTIFINNYDKYKKGMEYYFTIENYKSIEKDADIKIYARILLNTSNHVKEYSELLDPISVDNQFEGMTNNLAKWKQEARDIQNKTSNEINDQLEDLPKKIDGQNSAAKQLSGAVATYTKENINEKLKEIESVRENAKNYNDAYVILGGQNKADVIAEIDSYVEIVRNKYNKVNGVPEPETPARNAKEEADRKAKEEADRKAKEELNKKQDGPDQAKIQTIIDNIDTLGNIRYDTNEKLAYVPATVQPMLERMLKSIGDIYDVSDLKESVESGLVEENPVVFAKFELQLFRAQVLLLLSIELKKTKGGSFDTNVELAKLKQFSSITKSKELKDINAPGKKITVNENTYTIASGISDLVSSLETIERLNHYKDDAQLSFNLNKIESELYAPIREAALEDERFSKISDHMGFKSESLSDAIGRHGVNSNDNTNVIRYLHTLSIVGSILESENVNELDVERCFTEWPPKAPYREGQVNEI